MIELWYTKYLYFFSKGVLRISALNILFTELILKVNFYAMCKNARNAKLQLGASHKFINLIPEEMFRSY